MDTKKDKKEIGYAARVNDYLIMTSGLPQAKINEIVVNKDKARGLVVSLEKEYVEVLMLDDVKIKPGETFWRTYQQFAISSGVHLLGRTINPLGIPIDSKGRLHGGNEQYEIDTPATGIYSREFIKNQFETGVTTVDMLVPVAKGQRELIIGDPRSGKTSFLIDVVVNQKQKKSDKKFVCIYALIGKSIVEIKRLVDVLETNKVMPYTIVVAASSSDHAPLVYLTPAVAVTIAEYFKNQGQEVLLILDDMGLHAKFYREISLLSNKPPGRESYPGDIFYQHSRLMERAGNYNNKYGGGSITALPVIETNLDDITGFITTNLMGMTDGHILFNSAIYHQGQRPGIDVAMSVSRVGFQTQFIAQKQLADKVKSILSRAEKLEALSRFGSDISEETRTLLNQSKQIKGFLNQTALINLPRLVQMIILGLVFTDFLSNKQVDFVQKNKGVIISYLSKLDYDKYTAEVEKMKDVDEFIKSLDPLAKELEKQIH